MKILVCAMEHSANMHLKAMMEHTNGEIELVGVFDRSLGQPVIDLRSLSIMGFVDAIKKLRFFFKLADQMVNLAQDVDKVLLIDGSGFNLPLAKKIKKRHPDKEIIYYILPQAWAWKKKRIPVLERTIDTLASILPFEKDHYSPGAPIEYVGHPLLDQIKRLKENVSSDVQTITFMPGSRRSEIKRLMPVFSQIRTALDCKTILVIPEHFAKEELNAIYGNLSAFSVMHDAHDALYQSDFAFICSGTATLEAALIGTPFVLAYKAKPIDAMIARQLVKLNYIGLANLMMERHTGEALHPECIQENATPENILHAYSAMDRRKFFEQAKILRAYLDHGSSKRMAQIIEETHEN